MRPRHAIVPVAVLAAATLALHVARRVRRGRLARRTLRRSSGVPVEALLEREIGVPVRHGNAVDLVEDGAVFDALEEEIRSARESVHVAAYIWGGTQDPSARLGRALLERRPGVRCRMVLDWIGAKLPWSRREFDPELERRLRRSGVELHVHMPFPDPFRAAHHRLFVFDGRRAIVGGFGVWRAWLGNGVVEPGEAEGTQWRDTALRVRGPVVGDLQRAFDRALRVAGGNPLPASAHPALAPEGPCRAAAVASAPAWAGATLAARMYYALAGSARRRLLVANSYFVPEASLRHVLVDRARAGVDVRVLVPGPHHDLPVVRAGQRRTYAPLLRGGVRIFEYAAAMMHAKTLVSDDVAVVGSTNMDSQSLSFLWDTSVVVPSGDLADRLARRFEVDVSRSEEIRLDAWRRRPLAAKLGQGAAGALQPWL